jgi:hypothetical protein
MWYTKDESMLSRVRMLTSVFLSDFLGSVFRFPFWWYTDGLMGVVRWVGRSLGYRWRGYAIGLWVRNIVRHCKNKKKPKPEFLRSITFYKMSK